MSSMKLIRISGIEPESIVDGEGIRYVIFTQGCPHHCPGCHNPQTHPFGGGKLVSIEDILDDISKRKNWIDGITLSGGEPFCHMGNCITLEDTNGNRKLLKKRYEQKIDAVAAMMDAYIAYKLNRDAFE